jgi:S1-C subfamily serine protease
VTPTQAPAQTAPAQPAPTQDVVVAEPAPEVVEETPRQARASEGKLSRDQRKELQVALKWAGVYTSGIDGAFGRGTRRAMRSWQDENGFEPTGVLTTRQRETLMGQYNAILDGMDLGDHFDVQAGVQMQVPYGAVAFDRYEAPFALFSPTGTVPEARVLLISQPGDAKKMAGQYEIMQPLEIVPFEGKRERSTKGFLLTGANDRIVSHTEVSLQNGEIKGFTLIWPAGDEERRARVLDLMQKSFARTDGVLPATLASDSGQSVDLVSGLKVRTPRANGSGFFVDGRGTVITSAETVAACERITLNGVYEAQANAADPALGVAILTPKETLAPLSSAIFAETAPRLQAEVAVAGYSFGGRLSAPTLTFGNFEDAQGLNGEAEIERLALAALPGDAGGPVFDAGGMVMGVLLPKATDGARRLPESVSFAADAAQVLDFARANGVRVTAQSAGGELAPEDLTAIAADVTVLVSCW